MTIRAQPVAPRGVVRRARQTLQLRIAAAPLRVGAALLYLAAAGCDAAQPDRDHAQTGDTGNVAVLTVRDDAGRAVSLAAPARRVISLIPAQTEVVAILAGYDVLLARTPWDHDPRMQHLPDMGNALTPSVEWLAAQRPDLVIAWPDAQSRDVVSQLTAIGIPVYASRVESIAEIRSMVARLGTLLGTPERADSLDAAITAQLDAVRAQVDGLPSPGVVYLLSADPPMVAGPGTFVDELLRVAGASNVFNDLTQRWPQISLEEIVRRQPDVIIRPTEASTAAPLAGLAGRPGWRDVRAVRLGRVYAVDANLFNRPGPGVGTAAARLAGLIHSDSISR